MTREEQITLAKRIAQALPEVTRNEWMHWMQIEEQYGLEKAIQHAERVAQDITVRPAIQRANRLIAQAVRSHLATLQRLRRKERQAILGYVSWWLRITTVRGSLREEK